MKLLSISWLVVVALGAALAVLVPVSPASADPTTTTENITTGGLSGTRTTTVDGNTTTVVDQVSGPLKTRDGTFREMRTTTVTTGNPAKSQTVNQTTTDYDKQGGEPRMIAVNSITRSNYDEAGGYTETSTLTITDVTYGGKNIVDRTTRCDANGNVLSGTSTSTTVDKDGKTVSVFKREYKNGDWQVVSVSPPLSQGPSHHNNVFGWVLGIGTAVAILVASGSRGNANSNAANQSNGSQVAFTPNSESICLNKFANVTVSDPSHPGAQFQLVSQNTGIVQISVVMTTGPFDLTPFGTGMTNVIATEVGTGKMGMLPVTITPSC